MTKRLMSVAGSFYPADADSIEQMIGHFNTLLEHHPDSMKHFDTLSGNAVIVPHAGWVYSGFTANIAYRILARMRPKTVVIIGPSHRVGFEGVSIADYDLYETPMGEMKINRITVELLRERFALPHFPQAHHEHSTEVQVPFIKHYAPDAAIVEMVYAHADPSQIAPILTYLLSLKETAIVISTDLSHYYPLEQAKRLDAICLNAIRNENIDTLHQGCEACGMIGVESMLIAAREKGMEAILLDYRTSADASGDASRVVGYASALFHTFA